MNTQLKGNLRHTGKYGKVYGITSSGVKLHRDASKFTNIPLKEFDGKTLSQKAYNMAYIQTLRAYEYGGSKLAKDVCRVFAGQVKDRYEIYHDAYKSNQKTAFNIAISALRGSYDALSILNNVSIPPIAYKWLDTKNPYPSKRLF